MILRRNSMKLNQSDVKTITNLLETEIENLREQIRRESDFEIVEELIAECAEHEQLLKKILRAE